MSAISPRARVLWILLGWLLALPAAVASEVTLRVVDATTAQAIARARLAVTLNTATNEVRTDAEGIARIQIEPRPIDVHVRVRVAAKDYAPSVHSWTQAFDEDTELLLPMEKGTRIGGTITNEAKEPVAGVKVHIFVTQPADTLIVADTRALVETTNAEGKWSSSAIPASVESIRLRLEHPNLKTEQYYNYGPEPKRPLAQLRTQSDVIVLKRRIALTGKVTNPSDEPVANANIALGSKEGWPKTALKIKSDAAGAFSFSDCPEGAIMVSAQADGYGLMEYETSSTAKELFIRMEPAQSVIVRVVDKEDKPVEGAYVSLSEARPPLEFAARTDADGRVTIPSVPTAGIKVDVQKEGFPKTRAADIQPVIGEFKLVMGQLLQIHGTVVDAATGEPVKTYTVSVGIDRNQSRWYREVRSRNDGSHNFAITEFPIDENDLETSNISVRVESPEHLRAESPTFKYTDGIQRVPFNLKKPAWQNGTVVSADGKPAAEAELNIITSKERAMLNDGHLEPTKKVIRSNAEGGFRFVPPEEEYWIVCAHTKGYAFHKSGPQAEPPRLELKPWARVAGTVRTGAKVVANAIVEGVFTPTVMEFPVSCKTTAKTNAKGQYQIDHLIEGLATILHRVKPGEDSYGEAIGRMTITHSGGVAERDLGGTGRRITGRFLKDGKLMEGDVAVDMRRTMLDREMPAELKKTGDTASKKKWISEYLESTDGKAAVDGYAMYTLAADAEGQFEMDDVLPGDYHLSIAIRQPGTKVEWLHMALAIPRGKGPLELGDLDFKAAPRQ